MNALEQRHDLASDQAAERVAVRRVLTPLQSAFTAEPLRVLPPQTQERPNDAVLASELDPLRGPAGSEPVQDGFDLVGERVPGRTQPIRLNGVAGLAHLGLAGATRRRSHH